MTIGDDLRRAVRGRVLVDGDDGFDQARQAHNLAVAQPVGAVVEAADAGDVAALVGYARRAGLTVTAQPNGHGATGDVAGAILLRTRGLGGIDVDPATRRARVGAGVSWGEVLAVAGQHGLTGLAGSSAVVSVVGYTLGGGFSWFGRRYGIAANSVRSFDVVTADGTPGTVTADSDSDLFWALRGGGGDFAIVTAVEFDLHPAPHVYGGRVLWPATKAAEVLRAFQEITADAPEELTLWYNLLNFPPFPEVPEFLRGLSAVTVDLTFIGDTAEGKHLTRRLDAIGGAILDSRGSVPVKDLGGVAAEPTEPSPTAVRVLMLDTVDGATLLAEPSAPLVNVQVRHVGGAMARQVPDGGACGHIPEPYAVGLIGVTATPDLAAGVARRIDAYTVALAPHTAARKPFTALSPGDGAADAFDDATLARLRDIKRARDPHGVIRSNFPVM